MGENRKIKKSYLKQLLLAEKPNDVELMKYFNLDENNPLSQNLKLKDDIEIIEDDQTLAQGSISETILDLLNWNSRKNRKKKYLDFVTLHPNIPRIVSEGDSWFQHPLVFDTIDNLLKWYPIYCIAAGGDTLRHMHENPRSLLKIIENEKPKILLLSAGGNDILGEQFTGFLNEYSNGHKPGKSPKRFINQSFFNEINSLKELYYSLCKDLCVRYPEMNIIVHGYDYIIPNNPNVAGTFYQSKDKSWLGNPMIYKGIKDNEDKQAIIIYILDLFNDMIDKLANDIGRVHYVDLRGTIKTNQWHDEIHPNKNGYEDIAVKIKNKIRELLF